MVNVGSNPTGGNSVSLYNLLPRLLKNDLWGKCRRDYITSTVAGSNPARAGNRSVAQW